MSRGEQGLEAFQMPWYAPEGYQQYLIIYTESRHAHEIIELDDTSTEEGYPYFMEPHYALCTGQLRELPVGDLPTSTVSQAREIVVSHRTLPIPGAWQAMSASIFSHLYDGREDLR